MGQVTGGNVERDKAAGKLKDDDCDPRQRKALGTVENL